MQSMSDDMFPVLQLFLLVLTTLLYHKGTTNPNPSSASDYLPYEGIGSAFTVFMGPRIGKFILWSSTLYQVLYLYLQTCSPVSVPTYFPLMPTLSNPLPFTFVPMLGYILMIIGGLGRIWCYRTLGTFFTFELTIRSSHKLIKTGPYAYIRHPSYTFIIISTVGMFLVHHRLQNFFANTGKWTYIRFGPAQVLASCILLIVLVKRRVTNEERELSKAFGKEWTEYASKTNRFIPAMI